MSNQPSIPAKHHHWIVEFSELRVADERQRAVASTIDRRTLIDVLKLWVKVVTPGAHLIEQSDDDGCLISFDTRSQARKFVASFGGKLLLRSPA